MSIAPTIRKRAARLRWLSWSTMLLILLVLAAGTLFFVYASDLSLKDAARQVEFRAKQAAELAAAEREASARLQYLEVLLQRELDGQSGTVPGAGPRAQAIRDQIADQERRVASLRSALTTGSSDQAQETKEPAVLSPQFVNTIVTRILVVVLLAYFVQLLAGQYRYALRLSSHLDNTADAIELQLSGIGHQELVALLAATSPTGIDFTGKSELQLSLLADVLKQVGQK